MAIFEWRRFNFFELQSNIDNERISTVLNGVNITAATNGNGQVVICDEEGNVHVFTKGWASTSFKGHDSSILFCSLSTANNFLVTIANGDSGSTSFFKVWNLSKLTSKSSYCLRTAKTAFPRPCALGVAENGQFMAVGFERGNISLYRGDISRDRSRMLKSFTAGTSAIAGIAFKHLNKTTLMYVCSNSGVYVFNLLSNKDRDTRQVLDTETSQMRCCELQTGIHNEGHFMVGRDDAIYCYTTDGRGPCYVLDGEKQFIKWFRNHLIIVSANKSEMPVSTFKSLITVIDLTNKFIVFSSNVPRILAVFIEFGTCFLVSEDGSAYHLSEKDLQSKLNLLYKKNLFDIAVRIAKSHHLDNEGLSETFRQYGDHLYNKSNYGAAVEQYIKTIGFLEPSSVIRKFLDSRHIQFLSAYLHALHEKRSATADHTTLLVNCFTRLNKTVKLEEFFDLYNTKEIKFNVEIAAAVCRDTMAYDQALMLTEKSKKHNIHIDILLHDLHSPSEACSYIESLNVSDAKECLLQYGSELMEKKPNETVKLLKHVCEVSNSMPEEFIFIFVDTSEYLLEFLEDIVKQTPNCSQLTYNTLIELYLCHQKEDTEQKLMRILMDKHIYDTNRAIFLCRHYKFWQGLIYLFGEERLSHLIIRYCIQNEDYEELLNCCQRLGSSNPSLWLQALMGMRSNPSVPIDLVQKILNVIANEKLLSPLQVLNSLAVENGPCLGAVRDFFIRAFKKEMESRKRDEETIKKYIDSSSILKEKIMKLKETPVDFKDPACGSCKQALTLPSMHFYCRHSFHLDCIQSFSETDKECQVCISQNHQIVDVLRAQGPLQANHEQFHTLLERSSETFLVISEYLGRGLFQQILLVDECDVDAVPGDTHIQEKPEVAPKLAPNNPFDQNEQPGNPFEAYDETKNPFNDEPQEDTYDTNLNPFT